MNTSTKIVLAAACLAAFPAAADSVPDRRSVTVSGRGEISVTPDRARLAMTAESTKPALRDAQAEVNGIVRDYLTKARALGAKDEDISTAGLSIAAEYDYVKERRVFRGFHVSRGIQVLVRDLDKTGDFLLRATDAGINGVSDPVLENSKADALQNEALAKAAADAQAKAKVLADALGVRLGPAHTVSSNAEFAPPMPMMRYKTMTAAAAPSADASGNEQMGFAAGQIKVTATLTADFDLVVP